MTLSPTHSRSLAAVRGVSLIEVMVALAIATLLLLGLSQIFIGSKQTYALQEGMSRAQENARFVFGGLETSMRMAGYYGCGNESASSRKFYNHIPVAGAAPLFSLRFQRPIEGFDATNCNTASCSNDGADPAPAASTGAWAPALDPTVFAAAPKPIAGSDILVLRVLSSQSAPTVGPFAPADGAAFKIVAVPGDANFVQGSRVYAISNCRPRVDIFRAAAASAGVNIITNGADNLYRCDGTTSTWGCTNAEADFNQPPLGQLPATLNAEVHQAQYLVYYVGLRPVDLVPALYTLTLDQPTPVEVVDGVESMQLSYSTVSAPNGVADTGRRKSANEINATNYTECATDPQPAECNRDLNWRKVVSVHVALLMRGQDIGAGAAKDAASRTFVVGGSDVGAKMTRPADGRFRAVYETTIAVRNRLSSF